METIQDAIQYTLRQIPRILIIKALEQSAVLETQFLSTKEIVSVESALYSKIIHRVVGKDCNIFGGKMKETVLMPEWVIAHSERDTDSWMRKANNSTYRIPAQEREYRDIIGVISVKQRAVTGVDTPYNVTWRGSALVDNMKNMLGAQSFNDAWTAPIPELLSTDIVRLVTAQLTSTHWVLEMELAYPENFSNINRSSIPFFRDMVLYATQQFIYNNLVIPMDEAAMVSGAPLGSIKELVYKYENARELYDQALTKFTGTESYDVRKQSVLAKFLV